MDRYRDSASGKCQLTAMDIAWSLHCVLHRLANGPVGFADTRARFRSNQSAPAKNGKKLPQMSNAGEYFGDVCCTARRLTW